VARLLLCLYTGRYPICRLDRPHYYQLYDEFIEARRRLGVLIHIDENDESNACHDLIFHAGLLKVADKYEIPDLAKKAAERTLGGMQSLAQAVISSEMTHRYMGCIMTAIDISYILTSKCYTPLKDAAVFLARSWVRRASQQVEYERKICDMLQMHSSFAWDMISKDFMCPTVKHICGQCHNVSEKVQDLGTTSDCSCGMRDLCGSCPKWDIFRCGKCLSSGCCRRIDTEFA
jgi:hypothetical protein